MDHFHIAPAATHVRFRYFGDEPYDGDTFLGYPDRAEWEAEARLENTDIPSLGGSAVEAFFQRWLYFGTLVSIFKIGGVGVRQQDFVETDSHGAKYLTTKRLAHYVAKWESRWAESATEPSQRRSWADTEEILNEVGARIAALGGVPCPTSENPSYGKRAQRVPFAVSGETLTAIVALSYTLRKLAIRLYKAKRDASDKHVNFTTELLTHRLEAKGWCRSDVRRMCSELGIDGQYYFAVLESPHDKGKHSNCAEFLCVAANGVNAADYRTRHVLGETGSEICSGGCDGMSADEIFVATGKVVDIIKGGGIPVVSWARDGAGAKRTLLVEDAVLGRLDYVAISHVWADGLGNPHANSLPGCQLDRIQRLLDHLPGEPVTGHARWFWMDTICVPVGKKNEAWRKAAIVRMADTYQNATAVLTLDAWLQTLPSDSSITDKMARLYVSNWMHRLWTVQESVLCAKLYVQFADAAQLLDDIRLPCQRYGKGAEKPPLWASYNQFPEQIEESCLSYIRQMQGLVQQTWSSDRGPAARSLHLAHLSRAFQQRATSRLKDETVCASTLLVLDTAAFLAIEGGKDVAERRMQEFWRQVGGVSKGIVFHHSPRLRQRGFRWAPRTLMGGRQGDFWRDFNVGVSAFTGYGLTTYYPGISIEGALEPPSDGSLAIGLRGDSSIYYSVRLRPEKDGCYPEWVGPARCALVLFRRASPDGCGIDAILGIVEHESLGGAISLLFQTLAVAEALPRTRAEGEDNIRVFGSSLADNQEWFVV